MDAAQVQQRYPTDESDERLAARLRNLAHLIEAAEREHRFPISSGDHQPVHVTLRDAAARIDPRTP